MKRLNRFFVLLTAMTALLTTLGSGAVFGGVALADGDTLRRGDSGEDVKVLQQLLKDRDCYDYDQITGYFGASTEDGVRKFQAQNDLKVDGVAGPDTMALLKQPAGKNLKNPNSVCVGMSGDKVREIQNRLKTLGLYNEPDITGYFGPQTEQAVKLFQQAQGITADGIVGTSTWAALRTQYKSTSLVPGMKGDKVSSLQKRLKDLGYYTADVTGLYGQLTQDSVAYFQKLNGLDQDGICGTQTYNAVFDKNAKSEKDARRGQGNASAASTPKATAKIVDTSQQSAAGQTLGQQVVDYAKLQLGKPYIAGTVGPNSFDCTGLVNYVYKHFNVTIRGNASMQANTDIGIKITDRNKLMPGDLVFFVHSDGIIGHVGIYASAGGNFIHASCPETGVITGNMQNAKDFVFGRRIFK